MIYWASTKSPVHLFKKEYESPEVAKKLKEDSFVDPTILAQDLGITGLSAQAVAAYQRRLGVREFSTSYPPRKIVGKKKVA